MFTKMFLGNGYTYKVCKISLILLNNALCLYMDIQKQAIIMEQSQVKNNGHVTMDYHELP